MIALAVTALVVGPSLSGLWLWLQGHLADRRAWNDETDGWHGLAVAELPDLTGVRRVPGATIGLGLGQPHPEQAEAPTFDALERVAAGLRGLDSERVNNEYVGRHRCDDVAVVGCATQATRRRALREPTAEFLALVAPLTADWCDSCRVGRDGERQHVSCPGCACPCSTVEIIGRPPRELVAR